MAAKAVNWQEWNFAESYLEEQKAISGIYLQYEPIYSASQTRAILRESAPKAKSGQNGLEIIINIDSALRNMK
ncbi:MAG: hypothetical protein AABX85_01135 [Nanoarchaeota archaeon]